MNNNGRPNDGDLEIRADGIYRYGENGTAYKISEYIDFVHDTCDIDDGKYSAILEFSTGKDIKSITVNRSQYTRSRYLLDLIDFGMDVNEQNCLYVSQALINKQKSIGTTLVHHKLGYGSYEGKVIYKLWKAIGVKSDYHGTLMIEPIGDWDTYKQMMGSFVFPYIQLQFIIAASLSAVLLKRLKSHLDIESPIIHLMGDSSSGKSTATKLAVSVFACPDLQEETLMSTYNATPNALIKMLEGLEGLPFALDELSTHDEGNLTNLIYKLCGGKQKARLNSDSMMKEREGWTAVIFSNGEKSILDNSIKNTGIQVRTFEISIPKWTDDAEHAEGICRVIRENYGWLAPRFVKAVSKRSEDKLRNSVDIQRSKLFEVLKENGMEDEFTQRRAKFYSLIMYSALICKRTLDLPFDLARLRQFIVEQEKAASKTRDISQEFMRTLRDYVSAHGDMFIPKPSDHIIQCDGGFSKRQRPPVDKQAKFWGVMTKCPDDDCPMVGLLASTFKDIVREYNHENERVILAKLKDKGLLYFENGRNTRKWKINDVEHRFYVVRLENEE